jgi:2'-5' RNA ligase
MIKKYNLALLPATKANEVIRFARNFSNISDSYLIGLKSVPHVTLRHFHAEESDIDEIWQRACGALRHKKIVLEFAGFSCRTFDSKIYWISLLPDKIDILHRMQRIASETIGVPLKENYDPHMTLLNTRDPECKKELERFAELYSVITDTFYLALGNSDEVGQFTNIIHSYK